MLDLTLSQVMLRIEVQRKNAAEARASMSTAEWHTARGYELCIREKELHTALVVVLELAAENASPAAPLAASN